MIFANRFRLTPLLLSALLVAGCETEAPTDTPTDSGSGADIQNPVDTGATDAGPGDAGADAAVACQPRADDYTPRVMMSATDTWAACVSDPGLYVRFDMSTSSITRTTAFERMNVDTANGRPMGFFDPRRDPTADEFTAARMIYLETEGLDSRVVRRTDEHYPQPAPSNDCRMAAVVTANPDYCAGPARLVPTLTASFRDGQLGGAGTAQRVHAARVEAALLWFFYISVYKESLTCVTTTADCDSAWAYYTGGAQRADAMHAAFSRLVRAAEPATHDRIWDGILAVRCWRGLDPAVPATNTALRERARDQLDRALTRGIIAVFESRLRALASSTGAERDAHFAFVKVIAPLLDRAVRARSAADATALAAQFAATAPEGINVDTVVSTLDRLFPCP